MYTLLQAGGLPPLCPACEEEARRLGWLHFLRRLALEPKLLPSVTADARGHLTCASPPVHGALMWDQLPSQTIPAKTSIPWGGEMVKGISDIPLH